MPSTMWLFCEHRRIPFPAATPWPLSRCRLSRLFEAKPYLLFRCTQESFRMRKVLRRRAKICRRARCCRTSPRSSIRLDPPPMSFFSAIPSSKDRAARRCWLWIRTPRSALWKVFGCAALRFRSPSRLLRLATRRGLLFRFAMPSPFSRNKASPGIPGHPRPLQHLLRQLRSLVSLSSSRQKLCAGGLRKPAVRRDGEPTSRISRDDHESPTPALRALPHLLDFRERHSFCFDLKSAFCGPLQDLVHRGDQHIARRDSGGSEDRQRRAPQGRRGKCDRGSGALSHLHEARLRIHDGKFRACDGGEQHFGGPPPDVVNHDVESLLARFLREGFPQVVVRLVELNGRIGSEATQFLQRLRIMPGSNYLSSAQLLCNLHGQTPGHTGGAKNEHLFALCQFRALAERKQRGD